MSEPATPRGENNEDEAPNKPADNPWYQQKVPAYQPLLTPIKIAWIPVSYTHLTLPTKA